MNESLLRDQAHVFYGKISDFQALDYLSFLSTEEIMRAEKYLTSADKIRHLISRVILKRLLARFLDMNVEQIKWGYGKNGKLFLCTNPDFQFNIAHSSDLFVIGFTLGMEIGVDVESLNRTPNIAALENEVFSANELHYFQQLPLSQKRAVFIQTWTRKEAMLKASGDGLTQAMNKLEVAFLNEQHFTLETTAECTENKTGWFLESATLLNDYRVAVAVKGRIKTSHYHLVNESFIRSNQVSE